MQAHTPSKNALSIFATNRKFHVNGSGVKGSDSVLPGAFLSPVNSDVDWRSTEL
jgi:hypothetical protein